MGDQSWDVSSVWILRPDDWHSTWVSWRADGSHLGWYVNLQRWWLDHLASAVVVASGDRTQ